MDKIDFGLEIELKKGAMKYFPKQFISANSISKDVTLSDLREEYLELFEEYFTVFGRDTTEERSEITKAYEYLKGIIENREETYASRNEITTDVQEAYECVINELSSYRFRMHDTKSYSANQNKVNENIIFELSVLQPVITEMLDNIAAHFSTIDDITDVDSYDNKLSEKLRDLISQLYDACQIFVKARENYHETWNSATGRYYYNNGRRLDEPASYHELGVKKDKWREARNLCCQVILDFYRQLMEINKTLVPDSLVHPVEQTAYKYDRGLNNITKGPNYYCYINREERESLTEQNTQKKRAYRNK